MIAYVDSSVLLRVVLSQPDRLSEWPTIQQAVTSAVTAVECLRTLDRRLRQGLLDPEDLADRRGLVLRLLERMDRVDVSPAVLNRAADPFPTPLGTLDAIHLATAILWREGHTEAPVLVTHDGQLATAARATGLCDRGRVRFSFGRSGPTTCSGTAVRESESKGLRPVTIVHAAGCPVCSTPRCPMTKHVTIAANTLKGFGLVATLLVASETQARDPGIVPIDGSVAGTTPTTYSQWAAKWWQWELSIPLATDPQTDTTGEFADQKQSGSVWFLAPTVNRTVTRTVTIPSGKWLFFPIIEYIYITDNSLHPWSPRERHYARTVYLDPVIDSVDTVSCEIDGVSVPDLDSYRSDTAYGDEYVVTLPEGNDFGMEPFTWGPSLDAGIYLMLKPLSAGEHTIHFAASDPYNEDVTYNLTVE